MYKVCFCVCKTLLFKVIKTKKWGKIVYSLALPVQIWYGLQKLELEVFGTMVAKKSVMEENFGGISKD